MWASRADLWVRPTKLLRAATHWGYTSVGDCVSLWFAPKWPKTRRPE
jgi:hypothetical protein